MNTPTNPVDDKQLDEIDQTLGELAKNVAASLVSGDEPAMAEALEKASKTLHAWRSQGVGEDVAILMFCQRLITKNYKDGAIDWSGVGADVVNEKFRLLNQGVKPRQEQS